MGAIVGGSVGVLLYLLKSFFPFDFIAMKHRHLTELDDADLLPYRSLRNAERLLRDGVFVAEGDKVVRALLATKYPIVSMLMSPRWYELLADEIFHAPGRRRGGVHRTRRACRWHCGLYHAQASYGPGAHSENPSHEGFICPAACVCRIAECGRCREHGHDLAQCGGPSVWMA
jgi:hypothetical protein